MVTSVLPVIMVGGIGSRLWPLSRAGRPKPFHALSGEGTLLQETVRRASGGVDGEIAFAPPLIVGASRHAERIRAELAGAGLPLGALLLEPVGRSTAAVAVAAAEWAAERDPASLILLLPSDHHVADAAGFRAAVARAAPAASAGELVVFGVRPTRPETGFGYILADAQGDDRGPRRVERFVEKPDAETAAAYLADGGYFWNAGVFLMRADRLLQEMARFEPPVREHAGEALRLGWRLADGVELDADALAACPSVSLDVAVMERTDRAAMTPIDIGWSDIGDFHALWEAAGKDAEGNAAPADAVLLHNSGCYLRTDGPVIAALGLRDLVVVVDGGVVLVAPRSRAQEVKSLVDSLRTRGRDDLL